MCFYVAAFWDIQIHCYICDMMTTVAAESLKAKIYCVQISTTEDFQSALPSCHPDAPRQSEGPFA